MVESIEKFLGLDSEKIEKRKKALKDTLRTNPGTEFLKARMKQFDIWISRSG